MMPTRSPMGPARRLRVAVVDDEPPARRKLQRWLERDPDVEVVASCADGYEALDALHSLPVDVVFLDVQMPELTGFDVMAQVAPGVAPLVVFATAYDHYALEAFRLHAVDYLLKPYDYGRFSATMAHVKAQHRQREAVGASAAALASSQTSIADLLESVRPEPANLEHIAVRRADRIELLPVEAIDWVGAEGNYVMVHAGGERHLIRENIGRLASKLDPRRFPRIHRSTVVRLGAVRAFYPASHGDFTVELHEGTRLTMSRTYRESLRGILQVGF